MLNKEPLQIKLCNFRCWVYNSDTGDPVKNAVVELDWLPGAEFIPDYALTTDSEGFSKRAVSSGAYDIRVRHGEYDTYFEKNIYFPECQNWPYVTYFDRTFHITPTTVPPPPEAHTLTFYLVDSQKRRIRRGFVTFEGVDYATDWDGRVLIHNVLSGSHRIGFRGQTPDLVDFNFSKDVMMLNRNTRYTVWVESQVILEQDPPPEPSPPPVIPGEWWIGIFAWLGKYWPVLLIGAVGLYVLPHAVELIKTLKPRD